MVKKNSITAVLVLGIVALLVVLAFRVRPAVTADTVAVIRATGMTCGSCSDKICRTLARQKGVAATEVDVAGGWVLVGFDSKTVKPETIAEKVRGAGYPGQVRTLLTPEQFRQVTGRGIGERNSATGCGGCGQNGGCGTKKQG
jgi:copper chaperone CopZ